MFRTSLRGVAFGLALVLATAALSPDLAEAGNNRRYKNSNHGKGKHRVERHDSHYQSRDYRGGRDYHRGGGDYRGSRSHHRGGRDYHRHSHGSNIGSFLGGVAVGAIIGSHVDRCPPPPPQPRRVWVYDCDPCGYHNSSYDGWVNHLVVVHDVPRCDIAVSYPRNHCGHWEGW